MRDFRDAKTMAHALRDALKTKAIETTHSESLELIAKAFGYANWNVLSAKIDAAVPYSGDARTLSSGGQPEPTPAKLLYCSFCGKSQHDVRKLIAGPSVFICDECVELCDDIVDKEDHEEFSRLMKEDEESGNEAIRPCSGGLAARPRKSWRITWNAAGKVSSATAWSCIAFSEDLRCRTEPCCLRAIS